MEYYQAIQNRAAQTAAVVNQYFPTMSIGGITAAQLLVQAQALGALAQARDDALAAFDTANNAENQSFLAIRSLILALPKMAQGDLDDGIDSESALLDLLSPAFAIDPRNSELALKRGKKVISALTRINEHLSAQTPPRPPISSGGKGIAELSAAIDAHPPLMQRLEDRTADVSAARAALRSDASALDRLNKRFYSKLKAVTHGNAALAKALAQIDTGSANLPATLSIRDIRQGGSDNRQLLVSYVTATFDDGATSFIEWRMGNAGNGGSFTNTLPADPSGNALGPFASGASVQLRTRVNNSNGTTTGSVRTLEIN